MKLLFAGLLFAVTTSAFSADQCSWIHPSGEAPVLANQKMATKTRYLCFEDYAVLHSGVTHTPLWSAEHLTRESLAAAKGLTRTNKFYAEPSLPLGEGATLEDYKASGYDRGHMSEAGARRDTEAMRESFSLANMVPQQAELNRNLWSKIERSVRNLAKQYGEDYVITGPIFAGATLKTIGPDRVLVPTQIFKAVYIPSQNLSFGIVVDNVDTQQYSVKTIHELEAMSGVRFPGIPENVKDTRIGGLKGV